MKSTSSFSLTEQNSQFLKQYANMSAILNDILDLYRKYKLQKEIQEGFISQSKEDATMAEEGFDDYVRLINDETI